MKLISLVFLTLAILSFLVCVTVRISENEWYENIEGQCGINDNGTCDGWQSSAIIVSLFSFMTFTILLLISIGFEKQELQDKENEQ